MRCSGQPVGGLSSPNDRNTVRTLAYGIDHRWLACRGWSLDLDAGDQRHRASREGKLSAGWENQNEENRMFTRGFKGQDYLPVEGGYILHVK